METYTVYRLTFKTQLHLGRATGPAQEGSLGLQKTVTHIPADTLFSAICQMWTTFYDTQSLTDFLSPYTVGGKSLPFMLTSAFPFAHDVYFYPKPLTFQNSSKKSKRVQFISNNIFRDIISGNTPEFKDNQVINGEKVWISPEEKNKLTEIMDDTPVVWKTDTRPRVTIGSQNAGSEIWHVQTVQFNTNCGLWFAVDFNNDDKMKSTFETLLQVLGDTGIGGERNAGYGLFDINIENDYVLPNVENENRFVTLSRICPKSKEQLEQLQTGSVAYNLNKVSAPDKMSSKQISRKQVYMFAEGSVLNTSEKLIGQLVDLRLNNDSQPVYRYGYAWQIGIKGTE